MTIIRQPGLAFTASCQTCYQSQPQTSGDTAVLASNRLTSRNKFKRGQTLARESSQPPNIPPTAKAITPATTPPLPAAASSAEASLPIAIDLPAVNASANPAGHSSPKTTPPVIEPLIINHQAACPTLPAAYERPEDCNLKARIEKLEAALEQISFLIKEPQQGLLQYQKWWFRNQVDLSINGEKVSGTPVFIHQDTIRLINDDYSYFVPLVNIDYIRTTDGLKYDWEKHKKSTP